VQTQTPPRRAARKRLIARHFLVAGACNAFQLMLTARLD
jgi:hypothetical protein